MNWLLKSLGLGLLALLPVLLIYLLVGQLVDMFVALTAPLQDVLPERAWVLPGGRTLRSVFWLIVVLLLVGMAARTAIGRRIGDWFERGVLRKLPLYSMLRGLTRALSEDEDLDRFRPALVTTWPHMQMFAFVVEEHANGDYTIFMPIAPTPNIGYVGVVGRAHVELVDVAPRAAMSAVLSWGDGAEAALAGRQRTVSATQPPRPSANREQSDC